MELKGQMIHVPESCSLMFLGSPRVDKLEELMGRGLYLSDIPIHDATRDVILVGEQARAQDGLKKRMDKLKVKYLPFILFFSFFLALKEQSIGSLKKNTIRYTFCERGFSKNNIFNAAFLELMLHHL